MTDLKTTMTDATPKRIIITNPGDVRRLMQPGGERRARALGIADVLASSPRRGIQARLRARILQRMTDMSPENTRWLRDVVADPLPCGRFGEALHPAVKRPFGRSLMRAASAIMLIRLGFHPIAYALYGSLTTLVFQPDDMFIGFTKDLTQVGNEILVEFRADDAGLSWTPKIRQLLIRNVDVPATMACALRGAPLGDLVRHPMTDLIDVRIAGVQTIEGMTGIQGMTSIDTAVTCRIRVDDLRLEDIDPIELASASLSSG